MTNTAPRVRTADIAIVLGTTRPGRLGERVARWVCGVADDYDAHFRLLDLASYELEFFDEPESPLAATDSRILRPSTARWLDDMRAGDGYLFVTPEYNHAPPAVLKNALDHLAEEADGKPAAVLSYSETIRGGDIAAEQLKLTLSKLGMIVMPRNVAFAQANQRIDAQGRLDASSGWSARIDTAVRRSIGQLVELSTLLVTSEVGVCCTEL